MAGGFDALGLCPELVQAVDELGWLLPSDVQDEAIPLLLGGGDVMAAAETGSGKTGAFVLPVLQQIHEARRAAAAARDEDEAGPGGGWALCPGSKDAVFQLSRRNLHGQVRGPRWAGGRATKGVANGGRWYFEMTAETDGLCRVGWATEAASFDLGTCPNGYGFGGTGKKSNARNFDDYGEPFGKGDTIGCYADLNHGEIWFSKNGYEYEAAFGFNPRKGPLFPAVVLKNAAAAFNFGGAPFRFPPTDAMAVAEAQGKHVVEGSGGSFDEDCAAGAAGGGGGPRRTPMGVILEPSRDLAEQVASCVASYGKYLNAPRLRHALLVGGGDRDAERALREDCDIIVGTIGKVKDCIERRKVNLNQVRFFILDEADRFLETDNLNDILQIYSQMPSGGVGDKRLQVSFFSATLHSPAIADLSAKICHQPTWVDLKGKDSVPDTVHHAVVRVDPGDAAWAWAAREVAGVPTDEVHPGGGGGGEEQRSLRLKQLKPLVLKRLIDRLGMEMAMIFCRTNVDCDVLERFLTAQGGGRAFAGKVESGKENPYSCCVLAGMRSQAERRANLQAFREGDVRFLICTDVAARGIDVQGLPYVVNMTLPDVAENYIHRVGRVGRADCMGLAISIVAAPELKEKVWFHTCPNRGRGTQCTRRHLKDDGGCTIWYDEPDLLAQVEARLGAAVAPVGPDLRLPEGFGGGGGGAGVRYGEQAAAGGDGATPAHLAALQPAVAQLAALEVEAQNNWLAMKQRFRP